MARMSLHRRISELATSFAASVVAAIESASLHELHSFAADAAAAAPARRGPGRPPKDAAGKTTTAASPKLRRVRKGVRRSASDLQETLDAIVGAIQKTQNGMRSEHIQKALGLGKKEVSRPLGLGLANQLLKKKGVKRSTTYYAA